MSCDIIKRFLELVTTAQPTFTDEMAADIERQIRHEYAGERVYIPKHDKAVREAIAEQFTGNNTAKLAHELRVSRRTVYRSINKLRKGPNRG